MDALTRGDKPRTAHAALTYVYYWYNFMPLARGTAVTGYITLLAIFLAADMPITSFIPKDYQVDWEAILARSPTPFIQSVSPWLYPPAAREPPVAPTGAGISADSSRVEDVLLQASPAERRTAQAAADDAGQQQILSGA